MHADPRPQIPYGARRAVDDYVAQVREALRALPPAQFTEALADVRDYFAEALPEGAGAQDVAVAAAALGSPSSYASAVLSGDPARGRAGDIASGELVGVPYDLRLPTAERAASRWWDPENPRIFVPRVFGLGWDLNFGAIAVKTGLVRPDDEDVPFAGVGRSVFLKALGVPAALAAAAIVFALAVQSSLPATVPIHWAIDGAPDMFWSKGSALLMALVVMVVPTVLAGSMIVRGRSNAQQAVTIAAATLFGVLGLTQYWQSALWGLGVITQPWVNVAIILAMLVVAIALPFAELVAFSRIGRSAEWRRDLGDRGRGGRHVR